MIEIVIKQMMLQENTKMDILMAMMKDIMREKANKRQKEKQISHSISITMIMAKFGFHDHKRKKMNTKG